MLVLNLTYDKTEEGQKTEGKELTEEVVIYVKQASYKRQLFDNVFPSIAFLGNKGDKVLSQLFYRVLNRVKVYHKYMFYE